jgi:molecular chaperone GrpE (heat shock protein)
MSDDRGPARLAKWPFYLADLLLCAVIFFVLYRLGTFEGTTEMVIVVMCLAAAAVAAWVSVMPWLKEHDAAVHLSDSSNLRTSLEQIKSVEKVADLIRQSNAQWQGVQEASARTVTSAREITDRMKIEADEFMKFISNAHDQERAGLRLEVEKLRRMEGDWIKTSVQMLDHVFALTRAAERSGQAQLIKQLHHFQNACRDVARRMGLVTFVPAGGEPFDQRAHQLPNLQMTAREGDRIQDVLACGFTYQGQLLRRSLVTLEGSESANEGTLPEQELRAAEEGATPSIGEVQQGAADTQAPSEPPAIIDSAAGELSGADHFDTSEDSLSTAEAEQFEELPAVEETYPEEEKQPEPEPETSAEQPAEDGTTRVPRSKRRTSQEELPF